MRLHKLGSNVTWPPFQGFWSILPTFYFHFPLILQLRFEVGLFPHRMPLRRFRFPEQSTSNVERSLLVEMASQHLCFMVLESCLHRTASNEALSSGVSTTCTLFAFEVKIWKFQCEATRHPSHMFCVPFTAPEKVSFHLHMVCVSLDFRGGSRRSCRLRDDCMRPDPFSQG